MEFPQQFASLTIPTGAGTGDQRITINDQQDGKIKVYDSSGNLVDAIGGAEGQFIVYDNSGNMVASIASASGTDEKTGDAFSKGITTYDSGDVINISGNTASITGSDGSYVQLVAQAGSEALFQPEDDAVNGPWAPGEIFGSAALGGNGHPSLSIDSPVPDLPSGASASSILLVGQSKTDTSTRIDLLASLIQHVGINTFDNMAFGAVAITPSAANTPTSVTVTYPNELKGNSFIALTTANSSVPGTQVLGTSANSVTSTSAKIWLTRTNTTATVVWYAIIGLL